MNNSSFGLPNYSAKYNVSLNTNYVAATDLYACFCCYHNGSSKVMNAYVGPDASNLIQVFKWAQGAYEEYATCGIFVPKGWTYKLEHVNSYTLQWSWACPLIE